MGVCEVDEAAEHKRATIWARAVLAVIAAASGGGIVWGASQMPPPIGRGDANAVIAAHAGTEADELSKREAGEVRAIVREEMRPLSEDVADVKRSTDATEANLIRLLIQQGIQPVRPEPTR